ncbi:MAG: hypothetical protein MZV70_48610 [Desulfobacterales bacterium]|nr:hypothetical protein [Desulfobacterales bacterium]
MPLWSKFDLWNLYREYDTYNSRLQGIRGNLGLSPLAVRDRLCRVPPLDQDNVKDVLPTASDYIKDQAGRDDEQRRHPHPDPGYDE